MHLLCKIYIYLIPNQAILLGKYLVKSLVLACICNLKFASICSWKIELSCNCMYRTNQDNFSSIYIEYNTLHIPISLHLLGEPNTDSHNYVVSLITRQQLPFSCSFCHKRWRCNMCSNKEMGKYNSITHYNYKNHARERGLEHLTCMTKR